MSTTLGEGVRTAPISCPHCGAENDTVAGFGGTEKPSAGDISICAKCTNVGIFTEFGVVRQLTTDDLSSFTEEELDTLIEARRVAYVASLLLSKG